MRDSLPAPSHVPDEGWAEMIRKIYDVDRILFPAKIMFLRLSYWPSGRGNSYPSAFAALNSITAPRAVIVMQNAGHWEYPEQTEKITQWLLESFKGR